GPRSRSRDAPPRRASCPRGCRRGAGTARRSGRARRPSCPPSAPGRARRLRSGRAEPSRTKSSESHMVLRGFRILARETPVNTARAIDSVPLLDLKRQNKACEPELRAAFERVMASGQFILGPEVEAFESECAALLGAKHALGVSSGTDALLLAFMALGI